MDRTIAVLTYFAILAALLTWGFIRGSAEKRRQREEIAKLPTWAHEHGWTYIEQGKRNKELRAPFVGTLFEHRGGLYHSLTGHHRGWPVLAFQYVYGFYKSGSYRRRHFRVTTVELRSPTPRLEVRPRPPHDRFLLFPLRGDPWSVDVGAPRFARAFRVHSDSPEFARRVLHRDMTRWMLEDPRAAHAPVRIDGERILTWESKKMAAEPMLRRADYLVDVMERCPPDIRNTSHPPGG